MEDTEFQMLKLKMESENQRYIARTEVWKIVFGTMIVGIAVAFFPYMQKYAELDFADSLAKVKQNYDEVSGDRTFLEQLASEGRSESIDARIRLSEFYSFLADEQNGDRKAWLDFRDYLVKIQQDLIAKRTQFRFDCTLNETASEKECIRLGFEINEIEKYVARGSEPDIQSASCEVDAAKPLANYPIEGDALKGVVFCSTPNKSDTSTVLRPENVLIGFTASGSMAATVNWYLSPESKVSAHLVLDRDGSVIELGRFTEVLFHAGRSLPGARQASNRDSIGIEVVNWGELKKNNENNYVTWSGTIVPLDEVYSHSEGDKTTYWHRYSDLQIAALISILNSVQATYDVKAANIFGKSDSQPGRRTAPGPAFPWPDIRAKLVQN